MNGHTLNARSDPSVTLPKMHLGRIKRSYTPAAVVAPKSASNDPHYQKEKLTQLQKAAQPIDELDAWARRAGAASGFGEATTAPSDMRPRPDSSQLYIAARTHRSAALQKVVEAAIAALAGSVRRGLAAWRRARDERATYRALHALDSRTLHDIGLDLSEARSVAAELVGAADRTRVHALMTLRYLAI